MSDNNDTKMMDTDVKYWQDVENKNPVAQTQEFEQGEFDSFSIKKDRRSFLKIMGFSVTALPMTGCVKIPVRKAIPYLNKDASIYPGVANYYATTFDGRPVLLKNREGRPIKAEGNELSKVTRGATDAQIQASVLDLYDSNRLRSPLVNGKNVEWEEFDKQLKASLAQVGAKKVLVTSPLRSPSQIKLIDEFCQNKGFEHVVYSPVSRYAIAKANKESFGVFAQSDYYLKDADVIVSFGADFLGTFGDNLRQSRDYAARRVPSNPQGLSKHIQVEAAMSLTGSNADHRYTRSIKSQRAILADVYAQIAGESASRLKLNDEDAKVANMIVKELKGAKASLLISDDNLFETQILVNAINQRLGNFGKTVKVFVASTREANDERFEKLVAQLEKGEVEAVMFYNVNPAYDYYAAERLSSALAKAKLSLSFASSVDETAKLCGFVAPDNHQYESWSDNYVGDNEFSFTQPVIQPIFGSRMAMETLLSLLESEESFFDYVRNNWKNNFYPKTASSAIFENFWNKVVHDGVVEVNGVTQEARYTRVSGSSAVARIKKLGYREGLQVVTYQKFAIRDGKMANNPLLQEMPDPITKATWDNYVMLSPVYAKENGIKSGDVVKLSADNHSVTLSAAVIPGIEYNTAAVALGYGRKVSGKVGTGVGANAFGFVKFINDSFVYNASSVTLTKTGAFRGLALSQTAQSMEGRDIVRETTYNAYRSDDSAGNKPKMNLPQIYPMHTQLKEGHQWAMAIDLNTCTGCSTCVIACNTENNVPVVGRTEVHKRRDMHWMRIDRYFAGDEQEPETVHMPMLCQHCENAPCENVCPVLATVHSSDGINQQIYNRCVGTRYCANNCPYKVRRFNWFNYDHSDEYARMALNPDVSVRSRGIMEKCTFCIQRIQEGKLKAKRERRELQAGDIKTACQQSCPTNAIVFGDMNDKNGPLAKLLDDARTYTVLEELNVKPRVNYMVKVRNKSKEV